MSRYPGFISILFSFAFLAERFRPIKFLDTIIVLLFCFLLALYFILDCFRGDNVWQKCFAWISVLLLLLGLASIFIGYSEG